MKESVLIPEADIKVALDKVVVSLGESSASHAREIGGYMRRAFRPNPELVPIGVAIMYQMGAMELQKTMAGAYPPVMFALVDGMVREELRKLPGVNEIFTSLNL